MLAFIDESGHPHPNDSTLRPVLVAVCFSEKESHRIARQVHALKRRFLSSPEAEIHARAILNER